MMAFYVYWDVINPDPNAEPEDMCDWDECYAYELEYGRAVPMIFHDISGDVATEQEWLDDFETMDRESWFGLPIEECEHLHPIKDNPHLFAVLWNGSEWEPC